MPQSGHLGSATALGVSLMWHSFLFVVQSLLRRVGGDLESVDTLVHLVGWNLSVWLADDLCGYTGDGDICRYIL